MRSPDLPRPRSRIPDRPARLSSALAIAAIGCGVYAGATPVADLIIVGAIWSAAVSNQLPEILRRFTWRGPASWILAPIALSVIWSADPGDTAWMAARILGLFVCLPLAWPSARLAVPALLGAMVLTATFQALDPRPAALSTNAVTAAELGLFMAMSGSAWLAWMAVPALAFTKSRGVILAIALFAALARRRAIAAVAGVSIGLWILSAGLSGQLESRLGLSGLSEAVENRGDAAGIIDNGFAADTGELAGIQARPRHNRYTRAALGVGFAAYNESTGLQRPHSIPLLLWHELGILSVLVLAGGVRLLAKIPGAAAIALAVNYSVISDSAVGDPVGMFSAAVLFAHISGSRIGIHPAYVAAPLRRLSMKLSSIHISSYW